MEVWSGLIWVTYKMRKFRLHVGLAVSCCRTVFFFVYSVDLWGYFMAKTAWTSSNCTELSILLICRDPKKMHLRCEHYFHNLTLYFTIYSIYENKRNWFVIRKTMNKTNDFIKKKKRETRLINFFLFTKILKRK